MRDRHPGELLLRPVPIVAMGVLAANDHLLKRLYGNELTGKASDIAGLVFAPLLAVALLEVGRAAVGVRWQATTRDVVVCIAVVGALFALAKCSTPFGAAMGELLGLLRYPIRGAVDRVIITQDLSDLVALPALFLAWFDASRAIRRRTVSSHRQPCTRTSDP